MKTLTTILALLAAPAFAGDVTYVKDGCTHIPVLGADGNALYWNLGLETACGRGGAEGGAIRELKLAERAEDK